jgi:hypothetical protein
MADDWSPLDNHQSTWTVDHPDGSTLGKRLDQGKSRIFPTLPLSLSFSLSLSLSLPPTAHELTNRVNQPPESKDPAILGMNFGDRYSDPTDPSLGAILLHAHLSFHSFVHCSANQVEKNAWTEPVRSLISAVNDEQSGSTVTACVSPLSSRPAPGHSRSPSSSPSPSTPPPRTSQPGFISPPPNPSLFFFDPG